MCWKGGASRLYAFDLLWLDGQDLRGRPVEERRELLESLLGNAKSPLGLAERLSGDPESALAQVAKRGGEGIVLKRRGSLYEARRSRSWLKLKAQNTQELAIVGFTPATNSKQLIGALLLGVADGGRFRYAGKVGTGFSVADRRELARRLKEDAVDEPRVIGAPRMRNATWVDPKLVAQVRFTEWTQDGKLRHPAFQGLRPDKKPSESVREMPAPSLVTLTNPDKQLFPGITKNDLADYYSAVAAPLSDVLTDRPISFVQYHDGISGRGIFRQNLAKAQPWMHVVETPTSTARKKALHLVPDSAEALRWLAQNNAIELHMWASREGRLESPDWVIFDLDPVERFAETVPVAHALHRLLEELSLPSLVKTSGKRGLHIFVPLAAGHSYDQVAAFAKRLGESIASVMPQVTLERAKKDRNGRLYFDWVQNGYGKTVVAPYSPRAAAGAPVSTPLEWSEVTEKLDPASFNLSTLPRRLDKVGDLFQWKKGARLPQLR